MRGVVAKALGGPDVLEVRDVAEPTPGKGELLVDVAAAGVNYRDVYERDGGGGQTPPFVIGVEGAGTVAATGEDVDGFSVGDRVAWVSAPASYADVFSSTRPARWSCRRRWRANVRRRRSSRA